MTLIKDLYVINSLEKEGQKIKGEITVNASHTIFDGHFPGNPVLPGVCMIEIIKQLLEKASNQKYRLSEGSNVKFMNILNPVESPVVKLEHDIVSDTDGAVKLKSTIFNQDKVFLKFSGTFSSVAF